MVSRQSIRRPNPTLSDSVFKMFGMHGKVVIITGGTGGIGYNVARGLAEAGANVALWYHKSSQPDHLAAALEKDFGIKAKAYKCSVQNFDEVGPLTLIWGGYYMRLTNAFPVGPSRDRRCRVRFRPFGRHDCERGYPIQGRWPG